MSRVITVSAAQFRIGPVDSFEDFAQQAITLLGEAQASDVVVFPELFTTSLFSIQPGWQGQTTAQFGRLADYIDEYRALFGAEAVSRGQCIVAGSTLEYTRDGVENVSYTFLADGTEHRHVKSHIFPAESDWRTYEGNSLATFSVAGVTAAVAICYEAEIPEVATILARKGAEIIFCPSYTFTEAGFWRVRHCAAARCIENQIYMVHCSTAGNVGDPLSAGWARSSILSPCDLVFPANGVVAEAATNVQQVITATLDLDVLHENRRSGAATTFVDRHRRADMYGQYASLLTP